MRFISVSLVIFIFTLCGCSNAVYESKTTNQIKMSEDLIDAFYSFNKESLIAALKFGQDSIPNVVFYQGWAEGGHYKIVKRQQCLVKQTDVISCSITVQDDLMLALGIGFNVTDTFELKFSNLKIVSVETSSNDLDVFWLARDWVKKEYPELIEVPCKGIWNGGPTPGECVRAMVRGYALFAASDDFPRH